MNSHPSVSVITPLYKIPQRILRDTLASLAAQTLEHAEFLIADDGSAEPEMIAVLREFEACDSRFRITVHAENRGRSAVRNELLRQANGTFVTFLDGDDMLAPNYCDVLLRVAEYYEADMVTSGIVSFVDGENPALENAIRPEDYFVLPRPLAERGLSRQRFVCRLFRRALLGGMRFDETIYRGEDVLFIHEALLRSHKAVELDFPGYFYRTTRLEIAEEPDATPGEIVGLDPMREEYRCAVAVIDGLMNLKKYCEKPDELDFLRYFVLRRFLRQTQSARKVRTEPLRGELRAQWCRLYDRYRREFGKVWYLEKLYGDSGKRHVPGLFLLAMRGFFESVNFRYEWRRRRNQRALAKRKIIG